MDIYNKWGFSDNPFNTTSLTPDKIGNELIAGRDVEIKRFLLRLYNQPQIVTVEGDNGMGKTSIINVAVFRALHNHLLNREEELYIPCSMNFQLSSETNYDTFLNEVIKAIAQTIICHKEDLVKLKVKLPGNIDAVNDWLNSPQKKSFNGTLGVLIAQVGGGVSCETNTSNGFEESGFNTIVINWLKQIFPRKDHGGVVCVIDNLELLEKSTLARKTIENLRDTLFTIHGIRWVFCGSLGIVSSILSSPRLEGYLHDPISVDGILPKYVKEILTKRVEKFKNKQVCYLPITEDSFVFLYETLRNNIRNTIKYTNEFCIYVADNEIKPSTKEDKESFFLNWLNEKANKYKFDLENRLNSESLNLFTNALALGGKFSLEDYKVFGYESLLVFKGCVDELECSGIVVKVIDENDHRRQSILVTDKGWFVSHAMKHCYCHPSKFGKN